MAKLRLTIDGTRFRDEHHREVTLRGINVSGDCKLPAHPDTTSHMKEDFFDGDSVSFVGRPFPLEDAHIHFSRFRSWGMNTLRYLFTWEALEHSGPGQYDEEYIDFTIKVLRVAKQYGFYVFMDPHQDVWSRFTGGSGAPLWTIYACGFDPKKFHVTQAALVQNTWEDPAEFPKMIWATNYYRLAAQTIFTLFFGGKDFAPKAVINGQNIQDFLQGHFINACKYLAKRIVDAADIENSVVFGFESINEPNHGYLCTPDLSVYPKEQSLKKGPSPTGFQGMLTGSGRAVEMEDYNFGSLGPYKAGTALIDPEGESCWVATDEFDKKYNFKRDPDWRLGECLWAQHKVWDPSTDELLRPDYFATHPTSGHIMSPEFFINNYFMHHYRNYAAAIRSVYPRALMLCQPSPFEIPPLIKGTSDDDPNMIYATHFYDGITLLTKKWNRFWNVDVIGVLRGRYLTPALALKFGETAIRNCFKDQLDAMRKEGLDNMGVHPCFFSEIGIPYDMDKMVAYETGDYTSQIHAMDANCFALEGCGAAGYTIWVYTAGNNHRWGDNWNGEDLSLFSVDDPLPPTGAKVPASTSYERSSEDDSDPKHGLLRSKSNEMRMENDNPQMYRAAEAYIRPSPIYTHGELISHGFDLKQCTFTVKLMAPAPTEQSAPTVIYLPRYHFPQQETEVEVSGGQWKISIDTVEGVTIQQFKWWHGEGDQQLTIKGVKHVNGRIVSASEAEDSYLEQCLRSCVVM